MSEPVEWKPGDVITAERLNAVTPLVVHPVIDPDSEGTWVDRLDKTAQELIDAFDACRPVVLDVPADVGARIYLNEIRFEHITGDFEADAYTFKFVNDLELGAFSLSAYPSVEPELYTPPVDDLATLQSALLDGTTHFAVGNQAKMVNAYKIFSRAYFVDDLPTEPVPLAKEFKNTASWQYVEPIDPSEVSQNHTCLTERVLGLNMEDALLFIPSGTAVARGTKEESDTQ